MSDKTLYGTTWNANPSGVLWTVRWYLSADGAGESHLEAPGVFLSPTHYADEASMAAAFDAEAEQFFGKRSGVRP